MVAFELIVPWVENCEDANEGKSVKYADLMADCKYKDWSVCLFLAEVGWRGFPAQSVWELLARL